MIESLVQKHGKHLIEELLDVMVIGGQIDNAYMRKILLKNKVIKSSTKHIHAYNRRYSIWNAVIKKDFQHVLFVQNGNGKRIINLEIKHSELPEVMEMLKNYN